MQVNAKVKVKAVVMAQATSTEAPGVQAKVVMGVVMNHVRMVDLVVVVVAADVGAATKRLPMTNFPISGSYIWTMISHILAAEYQLIQILSLECSLGSARLNE